MVYSISYDLRKPGRDYSGLYAAIKTLESWAHVMESYWMVDTNLTANQIFDRLNGNVDENDLILVIGVTRDYHARLSKEILEWLESRSRFAA